MSAPRRNLDSKTRKSRMVEMDEIYGYRARIGYASPPLLTEVFAYDFYRLAPAGVTLALTSLAIVDRTQDEVDRSYEISMQAARAMASSGVDLVVLGGVTINLSRGYANADRMLADLSSELNVKVTSSAAAQNAALAALGSKKLVIARPYPQLGDFNLGEYAGRNLGEYAGRAVLGVVAANTPFRDVARLKRSVPLAALAGSRCDRAAGARVRHLGHERVAGHRVAGAAPHRHR